MRQTVQIIRPADGLSDEIGASIAALSHKVWPPVVNPAVGGEARVLEATLAQWRARNAAYFLIGQPQTQNLVSSTLLGHAMLFRREIFTSEGAITVGALATVCVDPDYRGRGWGADLVRAAFDFLPELGVSVALFQTPVPDFYAKLGCRVAENPFFDGTREDGVKTNPFWDACEMIYPASFPWPSGEIDLNGPGY